jgi:hypothetical protein
MKKTFPLAILCIINASLINNSCSKTNSIPPKEDPIVYSTMNPSKDTLKYSDWLRTNFSPSQFGEILEISEPALTQHVMSNGKVVIFERPFSTLALPVYLGERLRAGAEQIHFITFKLKFDCSVGKISIKDSLINSSFEPAGLAGTLTIPVVRYIIVPPDRVVAARKSHLDWTNYDSVTTFFKIVP